MRPIVMLLCLFAARASAAITCTSADNFVGGLTTIPLSVTSGAGDAIVVFTSSRDATGRTFTVGDTVNTYTNGPANTAAFLSTASWTTVNVGAATYTVTITASGVTTFSAAACNLSSVTASPLIGSGSKFTCASGTTTTCTSNSFSGSGAAGNIVIAYATSYDPTTYTAGSAGSDGMTLNVASLQNRTAYPSAQAETVTLTGAATTASIITQTGSGDPVYIIGFVFTASAASSASSRTWIL